MIRRARNVPIAAFVCLAAGTVTALAATVSPPEASKLAPHRAIYDLELGNTRQSSSVTSVKGRLVFEFTGSVCEGFTQNMRFVMNINNRDGGSTLSDLRSNTFESSGGDSFKFNFNDFQNDEATDTTMGNAVREDQGGAVAVSLAKPQESKVSLPAGTLFPVQQTIALLAAAMRGDHMLAAELYDGSDKGQKAFFTNSVLGVAQLASPDLEPVKNAERLAKLKSWPVTIAYFDHGSSKAGGLPAHEMSFQFYENGVIRKLALDYGTLQLRGTLSQLEFLEPAKCTN